MEDIVREYFEEQQAGNEEVEEREYQREKTSNIQ